MAIITKSITKSGKLIASGKLVAFATETVYGLGADANNDEAVRQVFAIKKRPIGHPLIVHVPCFSEFARWASIVPNAAKLLAKEFLPGPLTIVLPRRKNVAQVASGGHPGIALRVPAFAQAQQLIKASGTSLVAPSANRFGRPSSTTAQHVLRDFATDELVVLDGGRTKIGIESTIIDLCDTDRPALLRHGAIDAKLIQQIIGPLAMNSKVQASGTLSSHYSPEQKLLVLEQKKFERCVLDHPNEKVAAIGFNIPQAHEKKFWFELSSDPSIAASQLYAKIREAEKSTASIIIVEKVPNESSWLAVADRLSRAAN